MLFKSKKPKIQKKGPKQASISAFFSPQKRSQDQDQTAPQPDSKSSAAETPRDDAKTEANSTAKTDQEKAPAKKKPAAKPRAKAKAKGKIKASPKPKPKKKKPVRFISPHAVVDDEDDDDLDEEEDVFNTPEAKRAREELETGGETVPAGAPISDDAIVTEEDIVDVSGEDAGEKAANGKEEAEKADATTEDVVDLTVASTAKDKAATENGTHKARGKAAKSPGARSKLAAKTPTKRQQKMKEKAAAAAAAAAEAKAAAVEPLDPIVQARVDTYKLKTDELTRQFMELLDSKQDSDAIMKEIFGAALDCDLDVSVDHDKAQKALVETWQKLRDYAQSTDNAADAVAVPSTVEFPHEVKCLIVKGIQGRTASLSVVSGELLAAFKKEVEADDVDMEADTTTVSADTEAVNRVASMAMEMEIKMLAQRTPHGVRPAKANVFEDTSADALWVWEVGNLEKYFGDEAQKTVKRMRKHRKRLGQQLKTLARVVQLLHQKPVDEAKVSAEEAKIGKFGFIVDAELQKAKDRESKEEEKRQAVEEKKRQDLERQQAKEEEKRKREREEEEKKGVTPKRQKQFKSFFVFKSPDAEATGSNGGGNNKTAIDMTGDQDTDNINETGESRSAKMARIDAAINFLGSDDSSSSAARSSHQSIFSSLKNRRDTTKKQTEELPDGWSARRHRDPKLGVMKLLQFYENVRPAYYGTFSTRSRLFRGGRRPLAQYTKIDYSVDSDDEWEEEEPGESLSDADSDGDESDEDNLDYGDQWLAYEDEVDYMDDVEAEDDPMESGEGPSSPTKHKLPSQLQKKRVKAKAVKPAKLEPQIIGPFSCSSSGSEACSDSHFVGLAGELLWDPVFESTLMRKAREYEAEQKRLEALRQEQQRKKEEQQELEKQQAQERKAQEKPAATKPAAKAVAPKQAQQSTPQKASVKHPSASPSTEQSKPASATASASPSPAKPKQSIDSFFKKVECPTPTAPPQQQQPPQGEPKPKEDTVEVISVD
ncbi:unnamed protein product [Phytophthora lilii]|uniref:Unnamed protein product n=1 Tax=Phytophthora lilii TaxID=2077276 RepID=A0A9W6X292_9STRA|nr:unnamed protein product [Phytophthora lilii]